MNCNKIIDQARNYCIDQIMKYHYECEAAGSTGVGFYRYVYMEHVLYWTEVFVDQPFSNPAECSGVLETIAQDELNKIHTELPNSLAKQLVDTVALQYLSYLKTLSMDKHVSLPYSRTITGAERSSLEQLLKSEWNYTGSYWNPLTSSTTRETLFLMAQHLECYHDRISRIAIKGSEHVFLSGEGDIERRRCIEIDTLDLDYCGMETIYFDREANWVIYISHEGTITFAGSLLTELKELLMNVQDKWNKLEWA